MSPDPPHRARSGLIGAGLLLAVALALLVWVIGSLQPEEIVVDIPPGTAARMEAGEQVQLLPRILEVSVGDRLEIHNRDTVTHEIGPYLLSSGRSLRQTFTSPGTIEGYCSLHDSGAITIVVR